MWRLAVLIWHLVYGAPDRVSMANAIALSKQRNARYVYVTNGILNPHRRIHPWDTIPPGPYWESELTAALVCLLPSRATLSAPVPRPAHSDDRLEVRVLSVIRNKAWELVDSFALTGKASQTQHVAIIHQSFPLT